ncbi:MAG: glycosyltransferase, partial [Bdellovibrionota bacterium]
MSTLSEPVNEPFKSLHVIVPISADEKLWRDLLNDLVSLPAGSRVSLVGSQILNTDELEKIKNKSLFELVHMPGENHLATGMNHAAFSTHHKFLWFLHADSKIPKSTLANLQKALHEKPEQIHYCQLQFLDDGPSLMFLNSLAVQLRSKLLNLSFGHQGLALSKEQFEHVGGFDEELKADVVQ